ncbi:MAG TPA: hypothetical protein VKI19_03550, partial [Acidimicrobiales bacterium]|nr:hypothetical protein [Acidimicrobiales bacterium]
MKHEIERALSDLFRQQYAVAARLQLRAIGVTADQEHHRVDSGAWDRPSPRVVRMAGSPRSPEQDLMTALLETGPTALASHQSALWLWDVTRPPARHAVTVGATSPMRRGRFDLHRLTGPP